MTLIASRDRILLVWGGLVLATAVAWLLGTDHALDDPRLASAVVILIAFAKVRFVGRYFMELREAPTVLQALFDGWVVLVCAGVLVMYLAA